MAEHNPFDQQIHVRASFEGVQKVRATYCVLPSGGGYLELEFTTPTDRVVTHLIPAFGQLRLPSSNYLERLAKAINEVPYE